MYKIIAMDSEYCSMGRWISVIAGHELGLKLYEEYDLCQKANVNYDEYKEYEVKMTSMTLDEIRNDNYFKEVQDKFTKTINEIIKEGPCIIHEKAASYLLKDNKDVLKVMIYNANMEHKIPRCIADKSYNTDNMSHDELIEFINNEDKKRSQYYEAVTSSTWGLRNNYDLLLDSDVLSREKCAEVLIEACKDIQIDSEEAAKIISESIRWSKNVDVKDLG